MRADDVRALRFAAAGAATTGLLIVAAGVFSKMQRTCSNVARRVHLPIDFHIRHVEMAGHVALVDVGRALE